MSALATGANASSPPRVAAASHQACAFGEFLERVLGAWKLYKRRYEAKSSVRWAAVYHARLCASGTLLTKEDVTLHKLWLLAYMRAADTARLRWADSDRLRSAAGALEQFLSDAHTIDVQNCTVGLQPALPTLIALGVIERFEQSNGAASKESASSSCEDDLSSASSSTDSQLAMAAASANYVIRRRKPRGHLGVNMSTAELLDLIDSWADIDEPAMCHRAVVQFALLVRSRRRKATPGSLVIVRRSKLRHDVRPIGLSTAAASSSSSSSAAAAASPKSDDDREEESNDDDDDDDDDDDNIDGDKAAGLLSDYCFARFIGIGAYGSVVTLDGFERTSSRLFVSSRHVYALSNDMQLELAVGDRRLGDKYLHDHLAPIYERVFEQRNADLWQALDERGVNVALLRKARSWRIRLDEYYALEQAIAQLGQLGNELCGRAADASQFAESLAASDRATRAHMKMQIGAIDLRSFPITSRDSVLDELVRFRASGSVQQRFRTLCAHAESARERLINAAERFADGSAKRELTDWWLTHIRSAVRSFLAALGYDWQAVPDDYIDTPPPSPHAVLRNRAVLRAVLSTAGDGGDPHGVRRWAVALCSRVYERIATFCDQALIAICLSIGERLERVSFAKLAANELPIDDADTRRWVDALVHDVVYLQRMRHMDDGFLRNDKATLSGADAALQKDGPARRRLELSDVVPASGLVFGHFYRCEQEIITVCDIWRLDEFERTEEHRRQTQQLIDDSGAHGFADSGGDDADEGGDSGADSDGERRRGNRDGDDVSRAFSFGGSPTASHALSAAAQLGDGGCVFHTLSDSQVVAERRLRSKRARTPPESGDHEKSRRGGELSPRDDDIDEPKPPIAGSVRQRVPQPATKLIRIDLTSPPSPSLSPARESSDYAIVVDDFPLDPSCPSPARTLQSNADPFPIDPASSSTSTRKDDRLNERERAKSPRRLRLRKKSSKK
jgi:hypothetical protein